MKNQNTPFGNEAKVAYIAANYKLFTRIARTKLKGDKAYLAEDAASQAVEKALVNCDKYTGNEEDFNKWLFRLTVNVCMDIARKKRENLTSEGDYTGYENKLVTNGQSSSFELMGMDNKLIRKLIYTLSKRDAALLLLQNFYNYSGRELAQLLDIPEKGVTVAYFRAKERLAKKITPYI
jgi:RNA polymerase sigma-70 factor, ECF subfamily